MKSLIAESLDHLKHKLPDNVKLVAVSKTKPIEDIMEAYKAGQRDFGENRIQEMTEKYGQLPEDIRWHMIGHVQGNKIKYMAPFVHLVHGMDKPKRVKELNKEAQKNGRIIDCLIQIHIAREESKFGFDYDEAWQLLSDSPGEKFPHVRIRGLMGMATLTDNEPQIRNEFRGLKQFFDKVNNELNLPDFDILSMGMSGDFQLALDEGSNMIRIGSAIFGRRS